MFYLRLQLASFVGAGQLKLELKTGVLKRAENIFCNFNEVRMCNALLLPKICSRRTQMKVSKIIFRSLLVFSLVAGCSALMYAQQLEPSFNVSLNLIIGSNDAGTRGELPADLAAVSRQIKSSFSFSNYRLGSTLIGRISNTGNYEYKSSSSIFGVESPSAQKTFVEWSLNNFRIMPNGKGQNGFQTQGLRFGANVPVVTGTVKDQAGKEQSIVNYEPIGLNLNKVSLPENTPTLIGTLNLPGTTGTIFLIMTVKSAD